VTEITTAPPAGPGNPDSSSRGFTGTDALLAMMVLLWGVNHSIIKIALREITPLAFNAARFLLAAPALALLAVASGVPRPARRDIVRLGLLGLVGNSIYQLGFILGVAQTRAGNAALIMAAVPVETAVLSHLLGRERLRSRDLAGLLCSVAGIVVLVLGSGREVSFGGSITGDLLVFGATLCWSVYIIGCKPLTDRYGPVATSAWTIGLGTIPLLLYSLPAALAQPWSDVSAGALSALVFSALAALVVSYLIWFGGVQRIGPSRTAFYSNLTPIVVVLTAWPLLGETPTLWQIAGAAGIFTGLWLTRT
jgi:drug/metabolite transporter (DMT)-like permease